MTTHRDPRPNSWLRFLRSTRAQNLAEYGVALAVIGTTVAWVALVIGNNNTSLWSQSGRVIAKLAAIVSGG